MKGRVAVPDGVDASLAMDLDKIPCTGCQHKVGNQCRRYPPVFTSPLPNMKVPGTLASPGGWAFPAAAIKCGEFREYGT